MTEFNLGATLWPGLSKLIEEAGEVTQVAGKIIGLGSDGERLHWDGTDLRARLTEELADLSAAITFVMAANQLDFEKHLARRTLKLAQFEEWHKAQR